MHRIYQSFCLIILTLLSTQAVLAQKDTIPPSSSSLPNIFTTKVPREYTIADITVKGSKSFDNNLIISISGLQVGDKLQIPGTDAFSKAITKLWNQNLISDVQIAITNIV